MKKIIIISIISVVMSGVLSSSVFAVTATQIQTGANFCSNVTKVVDGVNQSLSRSQAQVNVQRKIIEEKIKKVEGQIDSKLQSSRSSWESNLEAQLNSLQSNGTITDVQKQAIDAYRATLSSAKTTRNAAIKAANDAFRVGLKQVMDSRSSEIDAVVNALISSAKTAGSTAASSCSAGTSPVTVRQTLMNSLKAAQTTFKASWQSIDLKVSTKPLVTTKNQAIQAAGQQFKATMKTAMTQLKLAFPNQ